MATKKVNKTVSAPVSQDETFVSLTMAKGLSENENAIEEKLQALYNIQKADTAIDKIYLLRGELPLEVKDIEDETEGLKTRIANNQADIDAFEAAIASNRQKVVDDQELIAKYRAQQDNVKNNREYESIEHEIEFQELDIQAAQKHIKDDTIAIEKRKSIIEETKVRLQMREDDLADKKKELEAIVEETAKEEERLLAERSQLEAKVDERMLAAYNRVRNSTKNRLAVVTVKDGACSGCFNQIPPQRQLDIMSNKKIIVCEYCGRILVNPSFDTGKDAEN